MTTPLDPTHERWDELAAGYALDALEPAEETELLAHVEGCAICRDSLRDHEYVAAQLGALADDTNVPVPSWSSLRAGIVSDSPSPALVTGDEDTVIDLTEERNRRRQPWLLGAAAAAVLLVVGVVTATQLGSSESATQQAISACRSSAACHVVQMQRGANERAVVLVRDGRAQLLPTDLSSPGTGNVYALWQLPRDGRPTLLAQPVSRADSSTAPLKLAYDDTAAFALSVEPAGPPATSPTTVVAVGTATT
jgi:hypothetical protein